ncbi:MAG TPA: hypothetical protein ENI07_15760 [Desulfobacterales bacterium]|nr:hypothetical protein [Desulfobacterales bacterium]
MKNSFEDLIDSLHTVDEMMEDVQTLDVEGLKSEQDIINDLINPLAMEELLNDLSSKEDILNDFKGV